MSTPPSRCPVTRAKNATQHPGQVVLDAQSQRRSTAEMKKVRTEERLDRKLTEKGIRAALKYVASVQDQQHQDDNKARRQKVAPSLRRHKTRILPQDLQVDPDTTDDNITDTEKDANKNRTPAEGEGETEVDDWFDDEVDKSSSDGDSDKDAIKGGDKGDEEAGGVQAKVQRPQKKKKGEGLPALIEALRKHPRSVGGNLSKKPSVSLVAKVPPIPALKKGKKPRGLYVFTSVPVFPCHALTQPLYLFWNYRTHTAPSPPPNGHLPHGNHALLPSPQSN